VVLHTTEPTPLPPPPPPPSPVPTLPTVEVAGEQWVVGGPESADARATVGYGDGTSGRARALVLSAAAVRAGTAQLDWSLTAEVFVPGYADEHVVALELSRSLRSARAYHEPGWERGWATMVAPSLSSRHVSASSSSVRVTLPAARGYEARGPELVQLNLPPELFSCRAPAAQRPPALLLVHAPRLSVAYVPPRARSPSHVAPTSHTRNPTTVASLRDAMRTDLPCRAAAQPRACAPR
jgi:hypothetical protein